jgi:hypothetical protein
MVKFNLIVESPDQKSDVLQKEFEWPVVPRKGEYLNIAPKGCTGSSAEVDDVQHWFGCEDIDVKCHLTDATAVEAFEALKEEDFHH